LLPHSEIKYWLEEKAFQSRDIKRYQDAFEGRLRVIAESQFIGNIFFAVAISGILLTLGTSILLQGKGWSQLLIYLVASRQGLLSFKDISQKITSINRFYPYLRRYFQFLENMEPDVRINPQPAMSYRVTVNLSPIAGSLSYWNLLTGNRLGLVSPIELNRYTLASLIDCLLGEPSKVARKTLNSIWFVTANYTVLPEYPFRKSLGLPVGYTYQKFCKEMKGTGLEEKVRQQLPRNLEKCLSRSKWTQVEPDVKFAVALLAASHSNAQWIILDEVGLQFLSDVAQQYLLERLAKKITVVVFTTTLTNVGKYKEDAIALLNQNELIGLGSVEWFTGNKEKIETILNQSAKKTSKSRSTDSYLGEDEDDLFEE
ncbi:MAG TPA: hypothetical protein DEG47_05295, partial [Cyanobacteria bacterium UBA11148]|nr:hypothetical protein [Cyanobacteria bacterium UBA11148]